MIIDEISNNIALGRSCYDAPEIDNQVYISDQALNPGDLVQCIIKEAYQYDLIGVRKR